MENLDRELIVDEMSQKIVDTAEEIAHNLGVENVNVRKLMQVLDITNRVFYNRFHNIEEVLDIIYQELRSKFVKAFCQSLTQIKIFLNRLKTLWLTRSSNLMRTKKI